MLLLCVLLVENLLNICRLCLNIHTFLLLLFLSSLSEFEIMAICMLQAFGAAEVIVGREEARVIRDSWTGMMGEESDPIAFESFWSQLRTRWCSSSFEILPCFQ
mmetsp:Transcript_28709/g.51961  ORF Transcript_28709/g.51961 Transcript_28709/m.51961 type:complete len:104 (-) Transcript_28709:398-709(-)